MLLLLFGLPSVANLLLDLPSLTNSSCFYAMHIQCLPKRCLTIVHEWVRYSLINLRKSNFPLNPAAPEK